MTVLDEYLSVQDAARELATTHLRLLMLVKQGTLAGRQEAGEWLVSRASLDCLKRHGMDPPSTGACRHSCAGGCSGH